jgi:hypothetical protein
LCTTPRSPRAEIVGVGRRPWDGPDNASTAVTATLTCVPRARRSRVRRPAPAPSTRSDEQLCGYPATSDPELASLLHFPPSWVIKYKMR